MSKIDNGDTARAKTFWRASRHTLMATFAEDAARERKRDRIRQQKAAGEEASVVPSDYSEEPAPRENVE